MAKQTDGTGAPLRDRFVCLHCGSEFIRKPHGKRIHKFCNRQCSADATIVTHGLTRRHRHHPLFSIWKNMKSRCENPNSSLYRLYGARGISVCERWRNDFVAFLIDVGGRPTPDHSIDRYPDNDGNYEPGNVRWATRPEQAHNRRTTKLTIDLVHEIHGRIEHGESARSVARRFGIDPSMVSHIRRGATWKEALCAR